MKKKLLVLFLSFSTLIVAAQDRGVETDLARLERIRIEREMDSLSIEERESRRGLGKVAYKFGGRLEARLYNDSYKLIESRDGLLPIMPVAPSYNDNGNDINKNNKTRFSVFSSRLTFGVSNIKIGKAVASAYIEGDFIGMADNSIQLFRMRHAFAKFSWEKDELLIGQTNNLSCVDEIFPNTVMIGAKPFNIVHRGPQVRYTHSFKPTIKLLVAAEYYNPSHIPTGPKDAQHNAGYPNLQMQMKFGDTNSVFGGFTGGVKFLEPRSVDSNNNQISKIVTSYSASGFFKVNFDGYKLSLYSIYGSNLSGLGFIGGYGKLKSDSADGNFGYANTYSMSSWIDIETPSYNKFKFGFFAGRQLNFGSKKEMDLEKNSDGEFKYGYFLRNDAVWVNGISGRVYYEPMKNITVGLEYLYLTALWGKEFDNYYKAIKTHPVTSNNRIELLLRFSF